MDDVAFYRAGQCRNDDNALSHTYAEMESGDLWPMCGYGWNRSNGHRFSIFRGAPGSEGDCKICARRVRLNLPPVLEGIERPTRWI
jgi:hypothetical protein